MNIYAVGDIIDITGQLLDSRGPYKAFGLAAKARIVFDDYSGPANGCTSVDIVWIDEGSGKYRATFPRTLTATIVPGEYVLEISVLLEVNKPITWYSGTFGIRASNITEP